MDPYYPRNVHKLVLTRAAAARQGNTGGRASGKAKQYRINIRKLMVTGNCGKGRQNRTNIRKLMVTENYHFYQRSALSS